MTNKNELFKQFDEQLKTIKLAQSKIKNKKDKEAFYIALKEGYKLMLLDKSPDNDVLFSYLRRKKGIHLSKKNPYYCIAKICLRKIKTSHVSRYGLALLHILHSKISIKEFQAYFRANGVTELSRKGSALHSKLKPNPQQAYKAGEELLEDEEFLVKVPRKKAAEKNCYVLYMAKVKKGDSSDYILKRVTKKALVDDCIRHLGVKHLGK